MRFISQYPEYKLQARQQRQRSLGDGSIDITQEGIYCVFTPVHSGGMIYENEVATAERAFAFRGNTQQQDEATPSDHLLRMSVYDTDEAALREGWDEETKAAVEAQLVKIAQESPSDLIQVTDSPIGPPFPRYDEWDGPDVERLIVKLIEDGHDLPTVLHYEYTFGKKRPKIIEALGQAIEGQKEMVVNA